VISICVRILIESHRIYGARSENLFHECPTCDPPGCAVKPDVTYVNYTFTKKNTILFWRLGIPLIVIFALAAHK
jgi:hypothetical protein